MVRRLRRRFAAPPHLPVEDEQCYGDDTWLPVLAQALGAKPPRRYPAWLARLFAGEAGVMLGTEARGASNVKVKREFGWTLRYPSWRQGFFEAYRMPTATKARRPEMVGSRT
jgi:hypothetical protein